MKHKVHQAQQRKEIDSYKVCSKCPPLARTQAHERVGQRCHQSVTALSLATYAADAVVAHQCHDSDVIVMSHVK